MSQYTYDELADDVKTRVETTAEALALIDRGIALLLTRDNYVYDHEREAIQTARYVACCIADRAASLALMPLRTVRKVDAPEEKT